MENIFGLHYHQKKKSAKRNLGPYPRPSKWKRFMDKSIYVVILISLSSTIPQITRVWIEKDTSGVSVITWTMYVLTSSFWLAYGVMHREKPIVFSSIAWILLNGLVAIGTIISR